MSSPYDKAAWRAEDLAEKVMRANGQLDELIAERTAPRLHGGLDGGYTDGDEMRPRVLAQMFASKSYNNRRFR